MAIGVKCNGVERTASPDIQIIKDPERPLTAQFITPLESFDFFGKRKPALVINSRESRLRVTFKPEQLENLSFLATIKKDRQERNFPFELIDRGLEVYTRKFAKGEPTTQILLSTTPNYPAMPWYQHQDWGTSGRLGKDFNFQEVNEQGVILLPYPIGMIRMRAVYDQYYEHDFLLQMELNPDVRLLVIPQVPEGQIDLGIGVYKDRYSQQLIDPPDKWTSRWNQFETIDI